MPAISLEKLRKIFKLEAELGYENRAVVGGLEKFLPSWEKEARAAHLTEDLVVKVHDELTNYPSLTPEARAGVLNDLLNLLPARAASAPLPPRPFTPPPPLMPSPRERPQAAPERPAARPAPQQPARPTPALTPAQTQIGLNAPITVLQGVGPKNAELFSALDVHKLEDLLYYFPRRYDDYSRLKPISRLEYGDELTVIGTVQSVGTRAVRGGAAQLTEAVITDGTDFLRLTWFNQPWITNRLTHGVQVVVSGKVDMYLGRMVMTNPDFELLEQEHLHTNRIVPVYPLSGRITQKWLRKTMYQAVTYWAPKVPDYLPASLRQAAELTDLGTALVQIHFPDSDAKLNAARHRLAFDEIFFLQLGVLRQKRNWQANTAQIFSITDEWLEAQTARLPFTLTHAQVRVLGEVRSDLASGHPMDRLLQGDVGSGKTVVAALAIAMVTSQDCQAALMAPTSILAEQHYRSMQRLLTGSEEQPGILQPSEIKLLIGDTPEAEKETIRTALANGEIKLVIGTHALIEDPIVFKALQLAVVDEQHRFGVAQRSALRAKGNNPHLLVMTATPIPRSLALTVYGDLDLAVMDEMPAGRQIIETHVMHPVERERAYTLIRSQIEQGHQVFIIYPLVEQGERGDESKAAVEEHARLQKHIFPQLKLGLLHGRMKPDDKEAVMRGFRDGEYHILVSTSVVEVGVDIPNATVMLIEGADRFGLAQLHQFRGRVGRGSAQSYCLLIPEKADAVQNERLAAMAETNDGFILAERDLSQRGPGDFLGTRQSGFAELSMASLTDVRLIEKARHHAQQLFEQDPELTAPEHQLLVERFERFWDNGRGDVS